uniref:Uncharacterized protein n=1 Tax=Arundo donax TaxID=35708 RepID=A0A0A9DMP4_ARUDO
MLNMSPVAKPCNIPSVLLLGARFSIANSAPSEVLKPPTRDRVRATATFGSIVYRCIASLNSQVSCII